MLPILFRRKQATTSATPTFENDFSSWLAANVTQLVFHVHVPKQTITTTEVIPCCTYKLLTAKRFNTLRGPTGKVQARYQLDTFSYLHDDTVAMNTQLVTVLHGFRGAMGNTTVSLVNLEDSHDGDTPPANATDKWTFQRTFDFLICYTEPVTFY